MSFDKRELDALAVDLAGKGAKGHAVARKVLLQGGDDLRDKWRANATESAGLHGRLYPRSITAEEKFSTDIVVEIGPDTSKPQGGMSFEFGSSKQPPHLDGQRAADVVVPWVERNVLDALGGLF